MGYFILVVSFGYFILFNLFVAILLQQFTEAHLSELGTHTDEKLVLKDLMKQTTHLLSQTERDSLEDIIARRLEDGNRLYLFFDPKTKNVKTFEHSLKQ